MILANEEQTRQETASKVFRRRVLMVSMFLAMGFAVPGAAQQSPSGIAPTPAAAAGAPAAPAASMPNTMSDLREQGRGALEAVVQVAAEMRNMALVANAAGDVVKFECIEAKRQAIRSLVTSARDQLTRVDDAIRAGDSLKATYDLMTLDTSRSKSQDLKSEAIACVGSNAKNDVSGESTDSFSGDDSLTGPGKTAPSTLDRPPVASPYR